MRTKKKLMIVNIVLLIICCLLGYFLMELILSPRRQGSVNDNQWLPFENRLAKLEKDFNKHHEVVNALREVAEAKNFVPIDKIYINHNTQSVSPVLPQSGKVLKCNFNVQKIPEVDIQMLDLYRQLEFDNVDGGVWKQGWEITYDEKQWHPNRKLKVFVVPHSHNDPGWLSTFEKYYTLQTRNILNNMVTKLAEDRRRKFIWAEVSFFQLWWDEQSKTTQNLVRRLIHDGQLEIVAGGWVMPDESVSHWTSQLVQLTEGHQWLKYNLDYTPNSGWAIDPFGLSPTMPYLLKKAGLENVLIQRVHYSVKKILARTKQLEFRWRQLWDNDGSTEIFTHVMPFYSYDVPHTCGPDPKICCQFDFYRLQNFGLSCPWRIAPRTITKANVAERAALLLDQYRKKAQLFKTDVVLAPLGDDFRYTHFTEWDAQYKNYQRLFDYMNKNQQMNVQIKFGTLSDYFDAIREKHNLNEFPTLSGDFFTYSDRDDHYWSGYYTSRPFHKRLDRVLMSLLRASEILSTVAWTKGSENVVEGALAERLNKARKWHSLFQHHDGITGTARDEVVIDYAKKMITALNNSAHVLQQSMVHLLKTSQEATVDADTLYISLDESRLRHTSAGDKHVLMLGDENPLKKVILYNSIPRQRTRVQTLVVSTQYVKVTDRMGQPVQCQVSPIWIGPAALTATRFELSFLVTVPGFGITTYIIHALPKSSFPQEVHVANVTVYNTDINLPKLAGFNEIQVIPNAQEFSITQRAELSASFGKLGLLKALRVGNTTVPVHLEFVKYGTRGSGKDKSGAYLFLPDKPEPDLVQADNKCIIHLINGPIVSKVFVELAYIRHTCTLYNSPGADGLGLHINNEINISETQNYELAMRLRTDIASGDQFYTDLNGLNMIKRQRFPKLPTQGNYYPMAASAYIEDKKIRLTAVTAQPLGVSSMAPGQIEIMQDRRLLQDDNRGLGQGVTDNLLTNHVFMLVIEKRRPFCVSSTPSANYPSGVLSLYGHLASEELLHPIIAMHPRSPLPFNLHAYFSPLRYDFPADLSIVSFRVFLVPEGAGKGIGMVLHQAALDTCWNDNSYSRNFNTSESVEVDLTKIFNYINDWVISKAPLTFHNVGPSLKSPIVHLCPHQILSILFHKTRS
ncbi:alpha-mannosidase 2 [Ceratina calcarata]|uniref:Alpha-mannosidase n=1 Tax=Ceratina calcarata TaxID=156304 RepID=A0AAJ7IV74_9HYME|nr:alpha-mannosidase 2 [Ceratina calcarata]